MGSKGSMGFDTKETMEKEAAEDVDQWMTAYDIEAVGRRAREVADQERLRRNRAELERLAIDSDRLYEEAEARKRKDAEREVHLFNEHMRARSLRDWEDCMGVAQHTAVGRALEFQAADDADRGGDSPEWIYHRQAGALGSGS